MPPMTEVTINIDTGDSKIEQDEWHAGLANHFSLLELSLKMNPADLKKSPRKTHWKKFNLFRQGWGIAPVQ